MKRRSGVRLLAIAGLFVASSAPASGSPADAPAPETAVQKCDAKVGNWHNMAVFS
jgi:hypothetical protein